MNRREFIGVSAAFAALTGFGGETGKVSGKPMLSYRPCQTGVFDVWLKWSFTDGVEDARVEVAHAGGVTGLSFNQKNMPGWHFAGTFPLLQDSEILATNRSVDTKNAVAAPPRGFEEVKLVPALPRTIRLSAHDGFSVCELNVGDTLLFTMANGTVRKIVLTGASAEVLGLKEDGIHINKYSFTQKFLIDGAEKTVVTVVPSVEFVNSVPLEVDGLQIFPDGVTDIYWDAGGFLHENCYRWIAATCRPMRRARIVVQDKAKSLVPCKILPCFAGSEKPIDPKKSCYGGNNCWMGPNCDDKRNIGEAHCGFDFNMPASTPVMTPFALDDQYYLSSLSRGDTNNRWRGVRCWDNGEIWWFQCHHIDHILKEEHCPLPAGERFALSGGMWYGSFMHSHFCLRVFRQVGEFDGVPAWESYWLNPGLLFRQTRADAQ